MADYETKASTVYLNINGHPTPKLMLNAIFSYNMSTGEYETINMPDGSLRTFDSDGGAHLTHADYDFTGVHTYSNLDYAIMRVGGGVEYQVLPKVALLADVDYADLTDDSGADGIFGVYGDESGSLFFVRTGVRIDF